MGEQSPDHGGEKGVKAKPHERIGQMFECEHFNQDTNEIEKVVDEFEGPSNEGEGVNQCA